MWEKLIYNLRALVRFEVFYKLLAVFVVLPILAGLLFLVMQITDCAYLTPDNIGNLLINPLTWLVFIIAIVVLTAYTIFDVATVILILDQSHQRHKTTTLTAMRAGLLRLKNIIQPRNILLPLVVLVLLPFMSLGLAFGANRHLALPEFISNFIENNTVLAILVGVVILLLTVLVIRWMYAFHYYILENVDFKTARQRSGKLVKPHTIRSILMLLLAQILYLLFVGIVVLIGLGILWLVNQICQSWGDFLNWFNPISMGLVTLTTMLLSLMAVPCIYIWISEQFYAKKKKRREKTVHFSMDKNLKKLSVTQVRVIYAVALVVLVVGGAIHYTLGSGKYTMTVEREHPTEVTAHRGFSAEYPENTMNAFRGAVENGADWIELDVQQTKDHVIVISHDNDTKRMTGVDKNIWDTNYAELATLDFGATTDPKFTGERIATLAEVLEFANKTHVHLNIEIKRNGHDDGIEEAVVKLIKQYHQENNSTISSLSYDTIKNVKAVDNSIKTLYVMLFAYGDIAKIPDVDGYSVEATSVTSKMIVDARSVGKPLMVWTVDDPDNMRRLDDMGVDNLITNRLREAKEIVAEDAEDSPYTNFWGLVQYALNI